MKQRHRWLMCAITVGVWLICCTTGSAQDNSWTNTASGKWEDFANWSLLAAPSSAQSGIFITNAATKTITIDDITTNSPGTMTISNLTLAGAGGGVNTQFMSNAGLVTPLDVLDGFTIGTDGVLRITNSALSVDGFTGGEFTVGGAVALVNGGIITTTNTATSLGSATGARLTIGTGAVMQGRDMSLSRNAGERGTLTIAGGMLTMSSMMDIATHATGTATVWITGGQLAVANNRLAVGDTGVGQMTVSNGTVLGRDLYVGREAGAIGTLTIAGGTNSLTSFLSISRVAGTTGAVWVTGGQLEVTNNTLLVGDADVGQMTISNGTVLTREIVVGNIGAGRGTMTLVNGTVTASAALSLGANAVSTVGTITVNGGQLVLTNATLFLGISGAGQFIVSNGTVRASVVRAGGNAGSHGIWTLPGGTTTVSSSLRLGNTACTATGEVTVAGGSLFVTNAAGTALCDVRTGILTLNSGTLTIDTLTMNNACGRFVRTGGALSITTTNLGAGLDADSDGLPNDWEQMFGFNPLSSVGAGETNDDPDGDGFTNLQEFQAGTVPTNSASFLGITSITQVSTNILITWMTGSGKTNALERTAGVAGSFSNNFSVVTNIITTGTTTNYLDIGAATNVPAFYYRVRLVQ